MTDLSDMSKVLSSKLGMLPDPTLDTAPWCDIAHGFPGQWRSLVKLFVSKRVEDATGLDPSDIRRELIDWEDQCDECSRAPTVVSRLTRRTCMAGLIGHEGTQAVPPVLYAAASTGRGYEFGSTSKPPSGVRPCSHMEGPGTLRRRGSEA